MSEKLKIAVGSDHAGFDYKTAIIDHLQKAGHEVISVGAMSTESYDYPAASDEVSQSLLKGDAQFGVLICGSGIGVCIRANRHNGIRAAQMFTTEMATLARAHNHANVACFGERTQQLTDVIAILDTFLISPEDDSPRHAHRVEMLDWNSSC